MSGGHSPYIGTYTHRVGRYGEVLWRVLLWPGIIDSFQVATSFCLRAFKDTRFPFIVMCVCYWLLTMPLGYWLGIVVADNPLDGTAGFWRSLIIGIALSTVLTGWRLQRTLRKPLPHAAEATS